MSFRIAFLPSAATVPAQGRNGIIHLGDEVEYFHSSLEYWSAKKYEAQWFEALQLICGNISSSALITSIRNPQTTSGVEWWPLYRMGDVVFIQNAIRFFKDLDQPFDVAHPYRFIPSRRTVTDAGEPVSEWKVGVEDVRNFIDDVRLTR